MTIRWGCRGHLPVSFVSPRLKEPGNSLAKGAVFGRGRESDGLQAAERPAALSRKSGQSFNTKFLLQTHRRPTVNLRIGARCPRPVQVFEDFWNPGLWPIHGALLPDDRTLCSQSGDLSQYILEARALSYCDCSSLREPECYPKSLLPANYIDIF